MLSAQCQWYDNATILSKALGDGSNALISGLMYEFYLSKGHELDDHHFGS
jgi:hypothetical protein